VACSRTIEVELSTTLCTEGVGDGVGARPEPLMVVLAPNGMPCCLRRRRERGRRRTLAQAIQRCRLSTRSGCYGHCGRNRRRPYRREALRRTMLMLPAKRIGQPLMGVLLSAPNYRDRGADRGRLRPRAVVRPVAGHRETLTRVVHCTTSSAIRLPTEWGSSGSTDPAEAERNPPMPARSTLLGELVSLPPIFDTL